MTRDELDALTARYLAEQFDAVEERLAADWDEPSLDEHGFETNERCHEIAHALRFADLSSTLALARQHMPDADDALQRMLARRMLEAQLQALKAELAALSGEALLRPSDSLSTPTRRAAIPAPRFSEVAARYATEKKTLGIWTPKTALQTETIFARVGELLGDPSMSTITKDDIRKLGLTIVKLPANMTKRYPGKTTLEIIEGTAGDHSIPRLKAASVNKYHQDVRSLFLWAVKHDIIEQNPATVLTDMDTGRAQDARKALDDHDIGRLFATIGEVAKESYGLWIPRIMAFTGCRMGEAAQLRGVDVRDEQSIWVFDFNADCDEKNLKTEGSARLVPIHSRLLELGILDFARSAGGGFLFPERVRLTKNPSRSNVDLLSKQLNRWRRKAGVTDARKKFQSFRATFATRLKDAGVPEYQIAELVGHENDNITTGRYGKQTNLVTLRASLERLALPI
jgi:integrase